MKELLARIEYNYLCLFGVDDGWDMGAHLDGSMFPLCGFWFNERGVFDTYAEATKELG